MSYFYLRYLSYLWTVLFKSVCFFFQAEDGIRDLVRSRGLGDVYKRQGKKRRSARRLAMADDVDPASLFQRLDDVGVNGNACLLYTSDAADERSSVDLGGRRIIKKKKNDKVGR